MHLNNRCAVTVDDPSEWAKNREPNLPQQAALWKPHWNWLAQNHTKVLRFTHLLGTKNQPKPWNIMKHHETLRGCTFTCMSAPGWNDEIPIGRFSGAVFWHGLDYLFFGWPNSAGFWGKSFTLRLKIGNPHSFYSFVISDLSKYHGYPPFRDLHVVSTSPCLDLVTSFGFLSIVQTPILLGASRTKVGENAWIAVLETRSSC